jgi:hypothetical protein
MWLTILCCAARGCVYKLYTLYKLHNNLDCYVYHLLWFIHMRPANQPTINVVAPCQEMLDTPDFRR